MENILRGSGGEKFGGLGRGEEEIKKNRIHVKNFVKITK